MDSPERTAARAAGGADAGVDDPFAPGQLLTLMQFSDSFFPGGATAYSWGLETLRADDLIVDEDALAQFVETLLTQRWASFDRPYLHAAWRLAGDADTAGLRSLDRRYHARCLAREWREGSQRLGAAQLRVHAALPLAAARDYAASAGSADAPGHLVIVQGLLMRGHGLTLAATEAMSGWTLCTAVVGAAIRLGLTGHLQAQRLLLASRQRLLALMAVPAADPADAWSGSAALDVAALRHETGHSRLFSN